ncbi:MAG TPA: glutathione S-transferase family protein, partial [Kiloniellales bacterium]
MYTLYWCPDTGAFAPHAALEEAGAAYELRDIDTQTGAHRTAAYLAVNPRGQVPALRLPDGTVIGESAAMVLHIADAHPAAGLLPPPGDSARAQAYRWLFFCVANIYEADLRYYYADRYTDDAGGRDGVRAAAARQMRESFALIERALDPGPYLLGDRYSVVDVYLLMLAGWASTAEVTAGCPRLK